MEKIVKEGLVVRGGIQTDTWMMFGAGAFDWWMEHLKGKCVRLTIEEIIDPRATHRCKVCGCLWVFHPAGTIPGQPKDSWQMLGNGKECCNHAPMGDQIEKILREETVVPSPQELKEEYYRQFDHKQPAHEEVCPHNAIRNRLDALEAKLRGMEETIVQLQTQKEFAPILMQSGTWSPSNVSGGNQGQPQSPCDNCQIREMWARQMDPNNTGTINADSPCQWCQHGPKNIC